MECQCEHHQPTFIVHVAQATFPSVEPHLLHLSKTPTGTCHRVRILSPNLQMPWAFPLAPSSKSHISRDRFYCTSGEPDATFSAFVASKFCVLQLMDKSATHAKPSFTDANVADFEVQPPYFLSRTGSLAQSWNCLASSLCCHIHKPLYLTSG